MFFTIVPDILCFPIEQYLIASGLIKFPVVNNGLHIIAGGRSDPATHCCDFVIKHEPGLFSVRA